ncbi:MAG: ABC transporter ATP-binding protein [Actinomycetaceae bacterium]|nr:ABC transporter ATP-binding protein [Actinomycetaceae bacterium]
MSEKRRESHAMTTRGGRGRGGGMRGMRGMPGAKPKNFKESAKRLVLELKTDAVKLTLVIFLGILSVGLTVIGPKLLGEGTNIVFSGFVSKKFPAGTDREAIIDHLAASGHSDQAQMLDAMDFVPGAGIDFAALTTILTLALCVYLFGSIFGYIQARLLNVVVQQAMHRLRLRVENKIHRLPLRYFDQIQRGELLSRVTNDVDNVGQTLQQTLSQAISALLTVVGVLIMMFSISAVLALIALVTIPLTMLITFLVARQSQKLFVEQWKQTGILNSRVEETYSGHALVKVFGHQDVVKEEFKEENERVYRASFGAQFTSGIIMPSMTFVGNLVYVAIAIVGGLRVASGQMSIGDVQAFIQYSRQFTQPLGQLGSMANLLQSGVASAERVFELLDEAEETPDDQMPQTVPDNANRLEFTDVSFRYEPEKPLIENLNLTVQPGTTVAIVGPTGAGKTTLVNLIMRFYEIDTGTITLAAGADGSQAVDTRHMSRADLRSRTGMVLQDTWLFGGSIRENIMYGNPDATEEQMLAAARAAYVDRFVRSLPDGYDTQFKDESTNMSVGEQQLITIARAFLSDPQLLILDEATSSVDTRTELLIQQAMTRLREGRTSFVIAHRLSTIRDADMILVMEDGAIVEQGTHCELLEAKGAYWRLYSAQFEGPMQPVNSETDMPGDYV